MEMKSRHAQSWLGGTVVGSVATDWFQPLLCLDTRAAMAGSNDAGTEHTLNVLVTAHVFFFCG